MQSKRPNSARLPSSLNQSVPLLDCNCHTVVDEEEEKRAALVMSRLHLRFNPSKSVAISPTQTISLQASPRAKDTSSQAQEPSYSTPLLTFPEWFDEGFSRQSRPVPVYQAQAVHTHSGRPASQWKQRVLPAGPFGFRMIGSRVRDSPHTGAMFAPLRGGKKRDYWSFLPMSVRKRHPELAN